MFRIDPVGRAEQTQRLIDRWRPTVPRAAPAPGKRGAGCASRGRPRAGTRSQRASKSMTSPSSARRSRSVNVQANRRPGGGTRGLTEHREEAASRAASALHDELVGPCRVERTMACRPRTCLARVQGQPGPAGKNAFMREAITTEDPTSSRRQGPRAGSATRRGASRRSSSDPHWRWSAWRRFFRPGSSLDKRRVEDSAGAGRCADEGRPTRSGAAGYHVTRRWRETAAMVQRVGDGGRGRAIYNERMDRMGMGHVLRVWLSWPRRRTELLLLSVWWLAVYPGPAGSCAAAIKPPDRSPNGAADTEDPDHPRVSAPGRTKKKVM